MARCTRCGRLVCFGRACQKVSRSNVTNIYKRDETLSPDVVTDVPAVDFGYYDDTPAPEPSPTHGGYHHDSTPPDPGPTYGGYSDTTGPADSGYADTGGGW